jgi:small-conductance mechanosensitive channel
MSEAFWISVVGAAGVVLGAFLGKIIDWIRGSRQDSLTVEEIEERINKSRLSTIADLQAELGTATKAGGDLRLELNRAHGDIEKLQLEISGLHQQLAANSETIAALAETNSHLMIEKREAMNEQARWQKKYLEAIIEREAFIELLQAVKAKVELVSPLKDKVEAMEARLTAVQNDTGKLKRKVENA